MSAPQAIKDALLRALDSAYDSDSTASERVDLALGPDAIAYEGELPASAIYKVQVDAQDSRCIVIRVKVRQPTPAAWPR